MDCPLTLSLAESQMEKPPTQVLSKETRTEKYRGEYIPPPYKCLLCTPLSYY